MLALPLEVGRHGAAYPDVETKRTLIERVTGWPMNRALEALGRLKSSPGRVGRLIGDG